MDIDLSKVLLIILAVLPGYLVLRGSARVIPSTQHKKGATEEIAEFLIFSIVAHFVAALLYSVIWMLVGQLSQKDAWYYTRGWFESTPSGVLSASAKVPVIYLAIYLLFSLCVGWLLGLWRGLFDVWHPIDHIAKRLGIVNSRVGRIWSQHVERYLITGRPITYDALFPEVDEYGVQKEVFVELVLKENQGSITGRLVSFSIANDEEVHKLLYLEDIYQKRVGASSYAKLDADGMLVDLADAAMVLIKQV
jgi:hypothetical protein